MEEIRRQLEAVVRDLFGVDADVVLTSVPEGVEGDWACNVAMRLAGQVKKSPREIADEIVGALREESGVSFVVAGGGFINITVSGERMFGELSREWSEGYGESDGGAGKLAVVEFPSPNVAKPYSVGHLRPGNQGWAVKKLLEMTGWRVVTDSHLGDTGTPFGVWVAGFGRMEQERPLTVYELGEMYIEMKKLLREEAERGERELADQVQGWLLKLENGDEEAVRLSEMFNGISLKHIHEVMGRLRISTDYELGERFFFEQGKELVAKYLEKGVFRKNKDGSVICELDGFEVPILMLKSNGAALYATTDLATLAYRVTEWAPDKIVHCVGQEQKFYFEQLFAMAGKIAREDDDEVARGMGKIEFVHLWFGMIDQMTDGKREKMSSRKGVVLMEELLDRAEETARELTAGREVSDEDVKRIALGAIKFTDFAADKKTGILFDWEKIFALSGYSGPFCQYAAVRVNRIIALNADFELVDYGGYDFEDEKSLIKLLLEYPAVVKMAAERLEAHRVANYVFRLAQEFNRYYEAVPVGKAEPREKSARLLVMRKVAQVMGSGLDLLGIEVPERM